MEYGGEISSTLKTEEKSERDAKLLPKSAIERKLRSLSTFATEGTKGRPPSSRRSAPQNPERRTGRG